jgi:hypothetical protein
MCAIEGKHDDLLEHICPCGGRRYTVHQVAHIGAAERNFLGGSQNDVALALVAFSHRNHILHPITIAQ